MIRIVRYCPPLCAWLLVFGIALSGAPAEEPTSPLESPTGVSLEQRLQVPQRRRISADGHDYGGCRGIILAVLLNPEPCNADEPPHPRVIPLVRAEKPKSQDRVYRIQLAAVREEPDARRAWELYESAARDVLAGLAPVIEQVETAGGTFYRLQAGRFGDRLDAEAVCDQLRQRNTDCLVVRR